MKEYQVECVDKSRNLRFIHIGNPIKGEAYLRILTPNDGILEKLVRGATIFVQGTNGEDIKSFQENASIKSIYLKVDDKQAVLLREGNRVDYDYSKRINISEIFPNLQTQNS